MTEQTAIQTRPHESGMTRVKNYILSPEVKERFSEMMGPNGIYYLNQVLTQVANSDDLQKCEPKSILIAAMRAASLRLSVDQSRGEAWIIPYKGKASFQLGYKGVYELALRTNQYRFINVIPIYEGETLTENRLTGIHSIGGTRTSKKVIARMLYFKLVSGYEKTFVMTVEEIEAHAKHYSQAYNSPRSKWNDPVERPKMENKTVLVNGLRRWGRFNANDSEIMEQIEDEAGYGRYEELPDESEVTAPEPPPARSNAQIMSDLGYDVDETTGEIIDAEPEPTEDEPEPEQPPTSIIEDTPEVKAAKKIQWQGKKLDDFGVDELQVLIENPKIPDGPKKYMRIVKDSKVPVQPTL